MTSSCTNRGDAPEGASPLASPAKHSGKQPVWLRNLWVCTLVSFIVSLGMSQLAPILPLYINELGVTDEQALARWSGLVFGCNFISLAVFSPLWGALADRVGCKPMVVRSTLGLSICMFLMGLAQSVWQLVGLRLLQGMLSGFVGAVITLIMSQSPKERGGWAMGVLMSGLVSGGLIGPLAGGWLSEVAGLRGNFFVMSACAFTGFLLLLFLVREDFQPTPEQAGTGWKERLTFPLSRPVLVLFLTSFVSQFALMNMAPVITVFIRELAPQSRDVALLSGSVFASAGLASILFGTTSGRLLDACGPARVLPFLLLAAGLLCIPQALVAQPWQLALLRFAFGAALVGVLPALSTLIKAHCPSAYFSRVSSSNFSCQTLGIFAGALCGGQIAALLGVRAVFWLGAITLLLNALLFCRLFPAENPQARETL